MHSMLIVLVKEQVCDTNALVQAVTHLSPTGRSAASSQDFCAHLYNAAFHPSCCFTAHPFPLFSHPSPPRHARKALTFPMRALQS